MNPDDSLVDQIRELYAITGIPNDPWKYGTITATDANSFVSTHADYHIKGEMLLGTMVYSEAVMRTIGKDEIKRQLATQLAEKMLESKFIEFTQVRDDTQMSVTVRARAYVVPDTQVKILRTHKV